MADGRVRLAAGVMGASWCYCRNAASLLLYAAPILTFHKVIRKRSTEDFSCVPYVTAFSNCFLYTWYGLPVVSCGWENFSLVTINGLGVLLELSFIITYFRFASVGGKASYIYNFQSVLFLKKVAMLAIPVILVSCAAAIISAFVFHDHHRRKVFIGSVGLVACVSMYGSPLVAVVSSYVSFHLYLHFFLIKFQFKDILSKLDMVGLGFLSRDLSCGFLLVWLAALLRSSSFWFTASIGEGSNGGTTQVVDVEKNNNGEKTKQQLQLVVPGDTSVQKLMN
ncbi:unnamed protein product [Thlaspi arvense]|uniref:Bidirectional sugar transporter SWEET n=1 Tax=Thlaspi arvense TaxID=13288 RepID=A0AAU9SR31_THLAR|nr:unnamed protein product [Thlaspi arvense]